MANSWSSRSASPSAVMYHKPRRLIELPLHIPFKSSPKVIVTTSSITSTPC
ncbi:hypothetical protein Mapa_013873 [Marchantia paleacea]|nr:hypothetical protein Mapa_013873 [Marchantia paleacea]